MSIGGAQKAVTSIYRLIGKMIGGISKVVFTIRKQIGKIRTTTLWQVVPKPPISPEAAAAAGGAVGDFAELGVNVQPIPIGVLGNKPVGQLLSGNSISSVIGAQFPRPDLTKLNDILRSLKAMCRGIAIILKRAEKLRKVVTTLQRIVRIIRVILRLVSLVGFVGGPIAKKIADIVGKVNKYLGIIDRLLTLLRNFLDAIVLLVRALTFDTKEIMDAYGIPAENFDKWKNQPNSDVDDAYLDGGGFESDLDQINRELTLVETSLDDLTIKRAPQNRADCHRFVEGLASIDNLDSILASIQTIEYDIGGDYEYVGDEVLSSAYSVIEDIRNELRAAKVTPGRPLYTPATIAVKLNFPAEGEIEPETVAVQFREDPKTEPYTKLNDAVDYCAETYIPPTPENVG